MFMTEPRRQLLNALMKANSIAEAAETLGISQTAARQRLYGLRVSYRDALKDMKEYRGFRAKMRTKYL